MKRRKTLNESMAEISNEKAIKQKDNVEPKNRNMITYARTHTDRRSIYV